jgi:hypothetical protein
VYSVDYHGVGFNASVSDHDAQEQFGGYTEDTLGRVELPLELSQVGEGFRKVGDELVLFRSLDDHIIDVSFNVFPYLRLQTILNCLLVGRTDVFQAKGPDLVVVDAIGRYKPRFVFIVRVQGYLVLPEVAVEEAE